MRRTEGRQSRYSRQKKEVYFFSYDCVFNPDTGALLEFGPESALKGHRTASRKSQIQATAAYTGRVGGYLEKTYAVIAVGAVGAAAALEVGGYYWVTEEAAPFVSRMAVRGWQVGKPLAQAAGKQMAKGFWTRVGTDFGIQFTGGFVTGNGSVTQRGKEAFRGINGTSLLVSGLVNTDGLDLSKLAKWLMAGSTAVAGNLVTVSVENKKKYKGSAVHLMDFQDSQQVYGFAFNVVLGMLLDRGREGLVEKGTEKILEKTAHASGRAQKPATRWVSATWVSLGLNLNMGSAFESGKKTLEHLWEEHNDRVKEEEEEAQKLARTRMPERPAVHALPHPHVIPK